MIKSLFTLIAIILFLILSSPLLLFEKLIAKNHPEKRDRQSLAAVKWIFRLILKGIGVNLNVKGLDNIPENESVLYVANHRSYFDVLAGYVTVPNPTGFVAKKEMERYPILSNWMEYAHCLFLDRKNIKEGLKTILNGIEKVKSGISIWIFPEGTRGRGESETDMLPFKEGSLKIAEKSGCPVIPVAILGSADVFEKHIPFMKAADITIVYGKPVMFSDLAKEEKKHAGAYVRSVILDMINEEKNN